MHDTEFRTLKLNGLNHTFTLKTVIYTVKGMCNWKESDLVFDTGPSSCPKVCFCASSSWAESKGQGGVKEKGWQMGGNREQQFPCTKKRVRKRKNNGGDFCRQHWA